MKPSERIRDIYLDIKDNNDTVIEDVHKCITSIMNFLDEEYEKKQCHHTKTGSCSNC